MMAHETSAFAEATGGKREKRKEVARESLE
jgi:hypothetical protein